MFAKCQGVASGSLLVGSSADTRRAVVSYWRKNVH